MIDTIKSIRLIETSFLIIVQLANQLPKNEHKAKDIKMVISCKTDKSLEGRFQFSNIKTNISKFSNFLIVRLAKYLDKRSKLQKRRAALKELSSLSDSTLMDIGITRNDAEWAFNKLSKDETSAELETFFKTKKACQ